MSIFPTKTHCTVCYTVPFLHCKLMKYIDIRTATNSSKAKEARSNRAGQANEVMVRTGHMVYIRYRAHCLQWINIEN
jgi:hypothetical protein